MAKGASLDIKVDATGNAVAELQRVQKAMAKNEKQLKKLTAEGDKSKGTSDKQRAAFKRFGGTLDKVKERLANVAIGVAAIGVTGKVFVDMVKEGAKTLDMFDTLSASVEKLPDLIMRVQASTAGMIDRQSIVEAAAEFQGFGLDVQQMPEIMGALAATSIRTGKDIGFLTDSLIEGISKTSDMRLDNIQLIGVFKQARAELDAQGVAYDDVGLKTHALGIAVDQLNAANADIDLMSTRTAQIQAWSASLKDLVTDLQEAAYEGAQWWGLLDARPMVEVNDALQDMIDAQQEMAGEGINAVLPFLKGMAKLLPGIAGDLGRAVSVYDDLNPAQLQFAQASGKVRAQLQALSAAQKLALFNQWASSAAWANDKTRQLIEGLLGTRDALEAQAAAADNSARAMRALAKHQEIINKLLGIKPDAKDKPKGAKRVDPRIAIRKSAKAEMATVAERVALATAGTDLSRAELRSKLMMAKLEVKRLAWEKALVGEMRIGVWYEQRELEIANELKAAKDKIKKVQDEITDAGLAQEAARDAAKLAVREIVTLSMLDRDIAAAKEPLERASLELQRARLEAAFALKQLGDDENQALVARAEITERLRDAQEQYNDQVERISNDELASQLRGVSRAAQGVAQQMQQIDSSMAPAAVAVADSADAWARYAEGQDNVATALANTVGAVGVAAQSWAKDEEMKAGIAALMQAAYAIAAFASQEYGAGAAHLVAAGMFTAIAAGAGGGGAAAGGGGGAPSAASVGGAGGDTGGGGEAAPDRRIIVQFHGGVLGSPQDVARSIQRAAHSARGSGQAPGW